MKKNMIFCITTINQKWVFILKTIFKNREKKIYIYNI